MGYSGDRQNYILRHTHTHTDSDGVAMVTVQEKAPLAGKHQSNPFLTLEGENSSFLLNTEMTADKGRVLAIC